jgi:hypothetical protein
MNPAPIKPNITNGTHSRPDAEIPAAQRFLEFLTQNLVGPVFGESIRRGIAQADAGESLPELR